MIPKALLELGGSKKAITFWVIVALWMPSIHNELGLDVEGLKWVTIAFCAYALAQGLADYGLALAGKKVD